MLKASAGTISTRSLIPIRTESSVRIHRQEVRHREGLSIVMHFHADGAVLQPAGSRSPDSPSRAGKYW